MADFVANVWSAFFILTLLVDTNMVISALSETSEEAEKSSNTAQFLLPVGTIVMYASDARPPGWLLCDGSEVSRVFYKSLFALIGTKYGPGDNARTFNLPDLRGRVALGVDHSQLRVKNAQALGLSGGNANHQLSLGQLPRHSHGKGTYSVADAGLHTHGVIDPGHNHGGKTGSGPFGGSGRGMVSGGGGHDYETHVHTIPTGATYISLAQSGNHVHAFQGESGSVGENEAFDIVPPFQAVNYIIYAG